MDPTPASDAPWWYDQIEVVLTVISAIFFGIYYGARWTARIETVVSSGFKQNTEEHREIVGAQKEAAEKLEKHSTTLAEIDAKVEDHRKRYP